MQQSLTATGDFKIGDLITLPILERRKWWQFWKPKYGPPKTGAYRITSVSTGTMLIDEIDD